MDYYGKNQGTTQYAVNPFPPEQKSLCSRSEATPEFHNQGSICCMATMIPMDTLLDGFAYPDIIYTCAWQNPHFDLVFEQISTPRW